MIRKVFLYLFVLGFCCSFGVADELQKGQEKQQIWDAKTRKFYPLINFLDNGLDEKNHSFFVVYSYGFGKQTKLVFDILGRIFYPIDGDDTFEKLLKLFAVLGFFGLCWGVVWRLQLDINFARRLILVCLLYLVGFHFSQELTVIDPIARASLSSQARAVQKTHRVPLLIATVVSCGSQLAEGLCQYFSDVGNTGKAYNYDGVVWGGQLLSGVSSFAMNFRKSPTIDQDMRSRLEQNFSNFCARCVSYDLKLNAQRGNFYSLDDLASAPDIMTFLAENSSKLRAGPYDRADGSRTYYFCRQLAQRIKEDANAFLRDNKSYLMAIASHPSMGFLTRAFALQQSEQESAAHVFARQQFALNALEKFTQGRSSAHYFSALGLEQLSKARMIGDLGGPAMLCATVQVLFLVICAMFPLVLLLSMAATTFAILSNWIKLLLTIFIAQPTFVLIDNIYTNYLASELSLESWGTQGISALQLQGALDSMAFWNNTLYFALMGSLMVAAGLVFGGSYFVGSLFSGATATRGQVESSLAAEEARGSFSFGNQSIDTASIGTRSIEQQTLQPHVLRSGGSRISDGAMTVTTSGDGDTIIQENLSNFAKNLYMGSDVTHRTQKSVSEARQNRETFNNQLAEVSSASKSSSRNLMSSILNNTFDKEGWSEHRHWQFSNAFNQLQQLTKGTEERHGINRETALSAAAAFSTGMDFGAFKKSLEGRVGADFRRTDVKSWNEFFGITDQNQLNNTMDAVRSFGYELSQGSSKESSTQLGRNYVTTQDNLRRAEKNYSDADDYVKTLERSYSSGMEKSLRYGDNLDNAYVKYLQQEKGIVGYDEIRQAANSGQYQDEFLDSLFGSEFLQEIGWSEAEKNKQDLESSISQGNLVDKYNNYKLATAEEFAFNVDRASEPSEPMISDKIKNDSKKTGKQFDQAKKNHEILASKAKSPTLLQRVVKRLDKRIEAHPQASFIDQAFKWGITKTFSIPLGDSNYVNKVVQEQVFSTKENKADNPEK